jgi:hypothetical protein
MFFDLDTNTNSSSNEIKSHMEDFILITIKLQQSDKGFGSGKNVCKKSYSNGLGAI